MSLLPPEQALRPTMSVMIAPGETLFVPAFWAHQVVCVDDCVSLTHNFLPERYFPLVRAAYLAHVAGRVSKAPNR